MKPHRKATPPQPAEQLRTRIEEFVRSCRSPAVLEPGDKTIPLEAGRFDLTIQGSLLVMHAWNAETSLVRRIVAIREETRGRLDLRIRRLGQAEGVLTILDLARAGPHWARQADRLEFRERFRRLLLRRFGEWEVSQISSGADLEHSLSPAFSRALLTHAGGAFAAIGAADNSDPASSDQILSFGLIWLDYLRAREQSAGRNGRVVAGLKLFLPQHRTTVTANRLAFLDPGAAACELFEFGPDLSTARVDEKDYGNLKTALEAAPAEIAPSPQVAGWLDQLGSDFAVERDLRADGVISLRLRGLEFARAWADRMSFGVEQDHPLTPANFDRVERLALRLVEARSADAPDKQDWLYRAAPEKWLESRVRAELAEVDSSLAPQPLYTQVPAVAGADRGIIDLLACDHKGRLAVVELKASEDLHLPLQGLDYWMRVKWHLDRGEFQKLGYFPGLPLQPLPPRLLLVSPVFDFHPTTETILRYFSPQVEVERVGLSAEWREKLKVVFRARGAEKR